MPGPRACIGSTTISAKWGIAWKLVLCGGLVLLALLALWRMRSFRQQQDRWLSAPPQGWVVSRAAVRGLQLGLKATAFQCTETDVLAGLASSFARPSRCQGRSLWHRAAVYGGHGWTIVSTANRYKAVRTARQVWADNVQALVARWSGLIPDNLAPPAAVSAVSGYVRRGHDVTEVVYWWGGPFLNSLVVRGPGTVAAVRSRTQALLNTLP